MKNTFAQRVINFNQNLRFEGSLPIDFKILNPFEDNPETLEIMIKFYNKYYNDNQKRKFIIGINPSRNGAGVTGIPFTDTKNLESYCGIKMHSARTHEVSSVFVYDMITQYGGVDEFYNNFYINSPLPLALLRLNKDNQWLNANYYDDINLYKMIEEYMILSLRKHVEIGLFTSKVFVLGKKNADFINKMNNKIKLFDKIIILEHPRYIQQYKFKERQIYIDKYLNEFHK